MASQKTVRHTKALYQQLGPPRGHTLRFAVVQLDSPWFRHSKVDVGYSSPSSRYEPSWLSPAVAPRPAVDPVRVQRVPIPDLALNLIEIHRCEN